MNRKVFSCNAQRLNDVMKGVEIIRPFVSLIKDYSMKNEKREYQVEEIGKRETDLSLLEKAISEIGNTLMKENLDSIFKKFEIDLIKLENETEILEKEMESTMLEIYEYFKYSESFFYLDAEGIVDELLQRAIQPDCKEDEFFAIVMVLCNGYADIENISILLKKYEIQDSFRKHILNNLEEYDKEKIIETIQNL